MAHVLVAGKLHPTGRALLDGAAGLTARYVEEISEASYAPFIGEADALLIRTQPLSAATVAMAERLKLVSRHGVGYDAVDVAALNARGIALAICGDVNSTSVAEHAMMLMLAAAKRALRADGAVRRGPWDWRQTLEAADVKGRNLLLVGYGRIGRHVARMASGFDMTIRAFDPFLAQAGWPDGPVAPVATLAEGLAWADIVSLSVPRGDRAVIGREEIAMMRDGVVIVNTARGGVVDEMALVDGLASGKVGAAGLDVFEAEPLPDGHPLTRFDEVILSPHIAGVTEGAAERMAVGAVQNIIDFFAGRIDPALVVNKDSLDARAQA
ncbi:hydroxyacid dehydrogenase [Acuticoccus sp. M5D2P5]|uniref:hydroxyacid dehydrogenase n=1 Tax=Acuticoccus kalidii TaxID=2910977 RepID=UPI001F21FE00|nr:hydroxyacid dehydrogenase [Acuticoccus kalidii]MCF3935238.1 hydroxyacid dehydrogenase [Acuticoccus kalidii]